MLGYNVSPKRHKRLKRGQIPRGRFQGICPLLKNREDKKMPYIIPEKVVSPKNHWKLNYVIYDEGEGKIAISYGQWFQEPVIAMRWNGRNEHGKFKGNPVSTGQPTWFILPLELGVTVVKELLAKYATNNPNIRSDNFLTVVNWLIKIDKISDTAYGAKKY
mgnify:CR=1 FL=1